MARVAKIPKAVEPVVPAATQDTKQGRATSVVTVLSVLLCLAVGIAGYFYYQYRQSAPVKDSEEIARLTKEIGSFMMLPENELPTLATVTDKEKLSEQPFFQKAENGDKVLIYTNSGRAILYRPNDKKIVDVTIVNVNAPETAPAQTETKTPTPAQTEPSEPVAIEPKVVLYNGSTKVGVTNTLEEELRIKFTQVMVVAKDKAAKSDYTDTVVVDLSGKHTELAKQIAASLDGIVDTLPSGEAAPEADILIIVGNK